MEKFYAVAKKSGRNELNLFGEIGGGFFSEGFDETAVAEMFKDIDDSMPLDVFINSVGGDVYGAMAIKSIIERHPQDVTIHVNGLAASAATLITCADNARCIVNKGSLFMVHEPRSQIFGPPAKIRQGLETKKKCAQSMADIYCAKTGKNHEEIAKIMQDETWLTAEEAVALGFADEVGTSRVSASLSDDRKFLAIGGRTFDLKDLPVNSKLENYLMTAKGDQNKELETKPEAQVQEKPQAQVTKEESEAQKPQALNAQGVMAAYPDQVKELIALAVAKERERIKAISELDDGMHKDIIFKAQFEEPITPEACAMNLIKAQKERAHNVGKKLLADGQELASALADVQGANSSLVKSEAEARQAVVNDVQATMKHILGY